MLRNIVPKPELKYASAVICTDKLPVQATNTFVAQDEWSEAFEIAQGIGLHNRIGDAIMLKMIEVVFDVLPSTAQQRSRVSVSGGAAGFGNVIDQSFYDQAIRLTIVDSDMDVTAGPPGTPLAGLPLLGGTQVNSAGGASQYHQPLDKAVLSKQRRHIRLDKRYIHNKGVLQNATDYVAPSTTGAPFGISSACYSVGTHRLSFKFPGQGMKLQFEDAVTRVPVRMPVAFVCGKNNNTANNPSIRFAVVRCWFTDP